MAFVEFCYLAFGVIDLFIVLVEPITEYLTRKKKIVIFLCFATLLPILRHLFSSQSIYIVLIAAFLLIYFLVGRKLILICLILFNYLLSIVLNYFALFALDFFWGITEQVAATEYYMIYYLFTTVLFIISSYCIRQIYNYFIGNHTKLPTISGFFTLLYLLICAVLFVYNYTHEENLGFSQEVMRFNTVLFVMFFSITGAFIVLLVYFLRRDAKIQAQLMQYETLQRYTSQVEELYQNIRGFKHDYLNILTTMDVYMREKNWDELVRYYKQEILPTSNSLQDSAQALGPLSNLQIPELKSILYNKFIKALELNIDVQLEIRKPITAISAKSMDIARVIGIYLDNAIDALQELDIEHRTLRVAIFEDEEAVTLIIQNDCPDFSLNIQKLGTISYSTKGENRGMGLHLAAQTLRPYKNILRDTTYEDHIFTQKLTIYTKEVKHHVIHLHM